MERGYVHYLFLHYLSTTFQNVLVGHYISKNLTWTLKVSWSVKAMFLTFECWDTPSSVCEIRPSFLIWLITLLLTNGPLQRNSMILTSICCNIKRFFWFWVEINTHLVMSIQVQMYSFHHHNYSALIVSDGQYISKICIGFFTQSFKNG